MTSHAVNYPRFSMANTDTIPMVLPTHFKASIAGTAYIAEQTGTPSYLLDDFEARTRPAVARQSRQRIMRALGTAITITGVILVLAATAAAVAIQMSGTVPIVF